MLLHDTAVVIMYILKQTVKPEWVLQGESRQAPAVGHSSGDTSSSTEMSPSAVEGMLLMAIEKLYKEDRELDVQMGLLRVVLQVLQRHGQSSRRLMSVLSLFADIIANTADIIVMPLFMFVGLLY